MDKTLLQMTLKGKQTHKPTQKTKLRRRQALPSQMILRKQPRSAVILVVVLILSLVSQLQKPCHAASINDDNSRGNNRNSHDNDGDVEGCTGLVLGPSRIPGAGWGIYAARAYNVGDIIGYPGGHAIPVFDIFHHQQNPQSKLQDAMDAASAAVDADPSSDKNTNNTTSTTSSSSPSPSTLGTLPEYLWEAANLGGSQEANHSVHWYLPGPVSLVNHHPKLANAILGGLNSVYNGDDEVTYLHDIPLIATKHIHQGDEIFLDYYELEETARHPAIQSMIQGGRHNGYNSNINFHKTFPYTTSHFEYADGLVHSLMSNVLEAKDDSDDDDGDTSELTDSQWMDILRRLTTELIMADSSSLTSADSEHEKRIEDENLWMFKREVSSLLPRTKTELLEVAKVGVVEWNLLPKPNLDYILRKENRKIDENYGDDDDDDNDDHSDHPVVSNSKYHDERRQLYCLDSVKPRTITGAKTRDQNDEKYSSYDDRGGVIVTRSFQAGEVVTIAPLVYIQNGTAALSSQILTNYCFTHSQHFSFLCPATYAAMIRHRSTFSKTSSSDALTTTTTTRKKPNVKIRWLSSLSQSSSSSSPLSAGRTTIDVLVSSSMIDGLAVNQSDAGTYNTYYGGLAFEYVALRQIHKGEELIIDSGVDHEHSVDSSLRQKQETPALSSRPSAHLLNRKNQPIVPSHDWFVQSNRYSYECQVYPNMKIQDEEEYSDWEQWDTNRMTDRSNWPTDFVIRYGENDFTDWYPCRVVNMTENDQLGCNVEVLNKGIGPKDQVVRRLRDLPSGRVRWVEAPYQSSLHNPTLLRSPSAIPDDIFPMHWREDYRSASSWLIGHSSSSNNNIDYEQTLRQAKCGLYLAPSNIVGAGYGIYTAVDVPAERVQVGSSVPVIIRQGKEIQGYTWQGTDYTWSGAVFQLGADGYPEYDTDAMQGLVGGMSNFHTGLVNIDLLAARSTPLLDRRVSAGAGSITDYANSTYLSIQPIQAGEELFISYGEHWLQTRESFNGVPLRINYEHADTVAGSLYSLLNMNGLSIPKHVLSGLIATLQNFGIENHRTKVALNFISDLGKLSLVVERNGTARATVTKRSQEWFDKNGFCQDHIYLKRSTLPEAGNGAFVRRSIPKGMTVIASPLVTASRLLMEMNYTKQEDHPINKKQLMMNYHFGHASSSLLLFPLTHATAINHNSLSSEFNGRIRAEPNAKVELSLDQPKSRYLLQRPLSDVFEEKYVSLFLNVVALRDLEVDEEVFIDYGEAWEKSWKNHLDNWKSPCGSIPIENCTESGYFVEFEMAKDPHNNRYHQWTDSHLTVCRESEEVPWNSDHKLLFLSNDGDVWTDSGTIQDKHVLDLNYSYSSEGFQFPFLSSDFVRPCQILKTNVTANTFDVVYFLHSWQIPVSRRISNLSYGTSSDETLGEIALELAKLKTGSSTGALDAASPTRALVYMNGLHREHIGFLSKPLSADCHDPRAFRHEIHIPDHSFPELWKDL